MNTASRAKDCFIRVRDEKSRRRVSSTCGVFISFFIENIDLSLLEPCGDWKVNLTEGRFGKRCGQFIAKVGNDPSRLLRLPDRVELQWRVVSLGVQKLEVAVGIRRRDAHFLPHQRI